MVEKIISKLKTRIEPSKFNLILKQTDIISYLELLQKCSFFFLLIKHITQYYAEVILKEISVIGHGNNTLTAKLIKIVLKLQMKTQNIQNAWVLKLWRKKKITDNVLDY